MTDVEDPRKDSRLYADRENPYGEAPKVYMTLPDASAAYGTAWRHLERCQAMVADSEAQLAEAKRNLALASTAVNQAQANLQLASLNQEGLTQ